MPGVRLCRPEEGSCRGEPDGWETSSLAADRRRPKAHCPAVWKKAPAAVNSHDRDPTEGVERHQSPSIVRRTRRSTRCPELAPATPHQLLTAQASSFCL